MTEAAPSSRDSASCDGIVSGHAPPVVSRRAVIEGAAALPLAAAPLAAILATPGLARAAAAATTPVSLTTAGGQTVSAALALPAGDGPAPGVLLIHEWWGLNDQIRAMAAELAKEGYAALAVDLFKGSVATTPDAAKAQTAAVNAEEATDTLASWLAWLAGQPRVAAAGGKVATLGWCFGGAWSLNAALAVPVDATVIYYGRVPADPQALKTLKGPVLGHFGEKDQFINRAMVDPFEQALKANGHPADIHWYDADHAFANPTGARYDEEDAKLAWSRTLAFLAATLKG